MFFLQKIIIQQSVKLTDAIWLLQIVISSPLIHALGDPSQAPHQDSNLGYKRWNLFPAWDVDDLSTSYPSPLINVHTMHIWFSLICLGMHSDVNHHINQFIQESLLDLKSMRLTQALIYVRLYDFRNISAAINTPDCKLVVQLEQCYFYGPS